MQYSPKNNSESFPIFASIILTFLRTVEPQMNGKWKGNLLDNIVKTNPFLGSPMPVLGMRRKSVVQSFL